MKTMDPINIFDQLFRLTDRELINFFFKAFAIVFSMLYLIYTIILSRQTSVLTDTLSTRENGSIRAISNVQLIASIFIFLFSLFLL